MRVSEIVSALKGDQRVIQPMLWSMAGSKEIKYNGQKKGRKYYSTTFDLRTLPKNKGG